MTVVIITTIGVRLSNILRKKNVLVIKRTTNVIMMILVKRFVGPYTTCKIELAKLPHI